ncbi:MAG: hypothetical protein E6G26_01840 [Actinobacteria bacterium]|nr:MAG: hypothetical protein E6G26_01840 [Actinomycetota bacterium]
MDQWLQSARDAMARASGVPAEELELSPADVRTLLDIARVAAHDSGDRTNAPLLCYLAGLTVGRGAELADVADALA